MKNTGFFKAEQNITLKNWSQDEAWSLEIQSNKHLDFQRKVQDVWTASETPLIV